MPPYTLFERSRELLTDLPPTIFVDALKNQEVIAIFHVKCRHVRRQISFESQCA